MKKIYAVILGVTALLLAATAAYFSVFGLSKLFIGASFAIIIMAGTLEFSKVVVVSFLHQYWEKIGKLLKIYLLFGTFILMLITSTGIYGFLSSAYSKVSVDIDKMNGNIELIDKKINIKKEEKIRLEQQIKLKENIRKQQEDRLYELYNKGLIKTAKKTEDFIKKTDEEISNIDGRINIINDSISSFDLKKLEKSSSGIVGEVGPLKYISKLTNVNMDIIVNWLMLLLIFVFDPLAVALVIATSSIIKLIKSEKKDADKKQDVIIEVDNKKDCDIIKIDAENNDIIELNNKKEVKQKNDDVVIEEYVEENINESGTVNESDKTSNAEESLNLQYNNINLIGLDKNNIFLQLLLIFYDNNNKVKGDQILPYHDFKNRIEHLNLSEKDVKDFLLVCNLLKITDFKNGIGFFEKEYEESRYLISKI